MYCCTAQVQYALYVLLSNWVLPWEAVTREVVVALQAVDPACTGAF